jgi:hypothetical protein
MVIVVVGADGPQMGSVTPLGQVEHFGPGGVDK